MEHTEVVCVGTGGVGSAALWHLARRGIKVIGLDRFPPAHDRGSSHGQTRIIRLAYFEHPDYVPLLLRSYELWQELEAASELDLYSETGLLEVGPPDGEIVAGVRAAAAQHDLVVEDLSATAVTARFPGFVAPEGFEAVFEQRAGFLRVERCIAAQLQLAQAAGADLRTGVTVNGWSANGTGFVVDTDRGAIAAEGLVITAGAWAGQLLADRRLPLTVLRKSLFWFGADSSYDMDTGCPAFFFDTPNGRFYGFPAHDGFGLKVANHSGGDTIDDPLDVDRSLRPADQQEVADFLTTHLPGVDAARPTGHAVCMYTNTPDGHFLVDRHAAHAHLSYVAGLSGHGFKMASALGEILADYATGGGQDPRVGFLSADRFNRGGSVSP